jgi:ribosomal protein S18 acetylase RimI-like enzyme
MEIKKATKKDFKEIAKILVDESSKKPYNEKYTFKTAFKEIEGLSKNELFLARNKKEVMGFIASSINKDDKSKAYVVELWLRPIYQRNGFGKLLVEFIEDKYKKKGIKTIRILVKRNAKAFGFYKKLKYAEYKELVFIEKKLR